MTVFEAELLAVLCLGVALALVVFALLPRRSNEKKEYWGRRPRPSSNSAWPREFASAAAPPAKPDLSDIGVQLNAIMKAAFQKRRVMNRSEYEIFRIVENEVASARNGYRAFAQTSLGQILESPNSDAFRSINSKRVDILVVDRGGWPAFAVEYQGPGHYQGTAAARDAIKKEALRRAGVAYLEVTQTDTEDHLRTRLRELLGVDSSDPKPRSGRRTHPPKLLPQLH